jgi:hypothetical protein
MIVTVGELVKGISGVDVRIKRARNCDASYWHNGCTNSRRTCGVLLCPFLAAARSVMSLECFAIRHNMQTTRRKPTCE